MKNGINYFDKGYIQSIRLRISDKVDKITLGLLCHGFVLINLGKMEDEDEYKFMLCDSWQGVHLMKCKETKFTLDFIYNAIYNIIHSKIDEKTFNDLFNDASNEDWKAETEFLKNQGDWVQEFSSKDMLGYKNKEDKTNFTYTLEIVVYDATKTGGNKIKFIKGKRSKRSKNCKTCKNCKTGKKGKTGKTCKKGKTGKNCKNCKTGKTCKKGKISKRNKSK